MAAEGLKRRMREVLRVLHRTYPDAECSLAHRNAFELLVATILSAQCTDERVNLVTPALFKKYGTPARMAKAPLAELEALVRSTNFYKNKARALKEMSASLVELHGGEVPNDLEKLVALRGVGRKTANVVMGNAFGAALGIVVDTHVGRISRRLGFTRQTDPVKVEHELGALVPREEYVEYPHLLIHLGRETCTARRAFCERCPLERLCPKVGV